MTLESRLTLSPPTQSRRALLAATAACLLLLAPATFAQAPTAPPKDDNVVVVRAAESDTINVSANGTLALTLARAPAAATNAMVKVVNSAGYALWSGPLTRSGGTLSARLDRKAVESLLIANAVMAEFPGAASGGKDLRISFVREVFQPALAPTAALVGGDALFYNAPAAPTPLEALGPGADAARVGAYAMAARRYDEQLAAYHGRLHASQAGAKALWTDLKTGGRLPEWPADLIAAQEKAYAALEAQRTAVAKLREDSRQAARAAVDAWNRAHPGETVELAFRDAS